MALQHLTKRRRALASRQLVLVAAVACVAVWGAMQLSDVNPVDFLVYRYAAHAALHGKDVFVGNLDGPMMPRGGLPFVYGPVSALLFWPTTLLGWHAAYVVWSMATMLCLAWVIRVYMPAEFRDGPLLLPALLGTAALTCVVFGHLKFGQVNVLLMAACVADLVRRDDGPVARLVPRGVLVGVATAVKLTPALFILFFIVSRQWRLARASAISAVGATLVGVALFPSASHTYWMHTFWHLSDSVKLGGGFAQSGNSSIQGAFAAVGDWTKPFAVITVVLVVIVALRFAVDAYHEGRAADAWLIVGLAAPLVSPISWGHHWVYLVPGLATVALRTRRLPTLVAVGVATLLLIAGPNPANAVFDSGVWLAWPVGLALRECLITVTCLLIAALHWSDALRMAPLSTSTAGQMSLSRTE